MVERGAKDYLLTQVINRFDLQSLDRPADLEKLAKDWGVTSIDVEPLFSAEAMLVPSSTGYKIILSEANRQAYHSRHRFSFAHELGHLLLNLSELQPSGARLGHEDRRTQVERLCDSIAGEILMPRTAFQHDAGSSGWSLSSLTSLAAMYETSIPATAIRMVDLMGRPCALGVWRLPAEKTESPKLQWSHSQGFRYAIQNLGYPNLLELVTKASNSPKMLSGIAPIIDKWRRTKYPPVVPAKALAWGKGRNRQVMVFYYP